ncbi:MAG: hypothetical protein LUH02_04225, partial [Erysipelotrichaceae bacterium]|nr:hypothetical protein [Erysipelotrichaceae bacterium]
LITYITIFVVTICLVVIFFANNFYVKKKAKNLAIQLVCGATYFQIAQYLLIQTGLLLLLAIPLGIILALSLLPVLNTIMSYYLHTTINITLQSGAISATVVILLMVIIWCTILNLGYAYRHSITHLLNDDKIQVNTFSIPQLYHIHISKKLMSSLSIILYIGGAIYLIYDIDSVLFAAILGVIGFYLMLDHVIIPYLNEYTHIKHTDKPLELIYFGFIRNDIIILKMNIVLLILSDILLVSLMVQGKDNPLEIILAIISFVVINVLLSLSIMFKLSTEVASRKKSFASIERIGYMKDSQCKLIQYEIIGFYGFLLISTLWYILAIFISLIMHHILSLTFCGILLILYILPLLLCAIITYLYYKKQVL